MTHPEKPHFDQEANRRGYLRIVQMVSNVGLRRRLPSDVFAIADEPISQDRFLAGINVKYPQNPQLILTGISEVFPMAQFSHKPVTQQLIDMLCQQHPGLPLICEQVIAEEFSEGPLIPMGDHHFRLHRPNGAEIDVYTPYETELTTNDDPDMPMSKIEYREDQGPVVINSLVPEDVTAADYQRAVDELKAFAMSDIGDVQSLTDLSRKTDGVGHNLRTVIVAKGEEEEMKEVPTDKPITDEHVVSIEKVYMFSGRLKNYSIFASVSNNHVVFQASTQVEGKQKNFYALMLPCLREKPIENLAGSEEFDAQAADFRIGDRIDYSPFANSDDPIHSQGFARVLQDGVRDIVAKLPPISEVPEAFKK